jgi:hypothetical protein
MARTQGGMPLFLRTRKFSRVLQQTPICAPAQFSCIPFAEFHCAQAQMTAFHEMKHHRCTQVRKTGRVLLAKLGFSGLLLCKRQIIAFAKQTPFLRKCGEVSRVSRSEMPHP